MSTDELLSTLRKVQRGLDSVSGKMDLMLMNQGRVNRALMPHEKRIEKPHNIPALPLITLKDFEQFEDWLADDRNLSAVVSSIFFFLDELLSLSSGRKLSFLPPRPTLITVLSSCSLITSKGTGCLGLKTMLSKL